MADEEPLLARQNLHGNNNCVARINHRIPRFGPKGLQDKSGTAVKPPNNPATRIVYLKTTKTYRSSSGSSEADDPTEPQDWVGQQLLTQRKTEKCWGGFSGLKCLLLNCYYNITVVNIPSVCCLQEVTLRCTPPGAQVRLFIQKSTK